MCRANEPRWGVLLVAGIGLIAASVVCRTQEPATAPVDPAPATPSPGNGPGFKATPEQIGDAMMVHQRYQAAIAAYKSGAPDSAEMWNKMGVAYQLMFNADEAARCYRMAMKLDPKNAIVQNNMGSLYLGKKEYSLAEHAYMKALKLDGKSALFHKNLGTALLAEHKFKKGWAAYQAALAIDPEIFTTSKSVRMENPATLQERGAMNYYMAKGCVRGGMTERGIEYLRMALNEGFVTPKKVLADDEFARLRDVPAFRQLMASQGVTLAPVAQSPLMQ